MCGICGLVDWDARDRIDPDLVKRMVWQIRHRGPDELAVYTDESAGLGHARLSIIDLSGGGQPMANEDASMWIVFNGEIYNYIELRPELERLGHTFATKSDTEVILHLYEEYGRQCLEKMNGQFAFAIWDRRNRRAFLARDRLGIRPLYYSLADKRLVFGSEVKSMFAVPGVNRGLDPQGLDQVFTFWSAIAPRTVFEGVRQLPPGHCLLADADGAELRPYWDLAYPDEDDAGTPQDCVEELRARLVEATQLRMRADVPVAAYLSGGLDSSLTSTIIKAHTDAPLQTFSVRFEDPRFDEGEHQHLMAEKLGTDHRSITVSGAGIARAFPDVVWHAETPILRTAPVPLYYLSRLVRENGIKVVVTGEGADEVFGGYNIFKENKIRRFWARHPNSQLRPLLLSRLYPYIRSGTGNMGASYWQRFFEKGLTDTGDPAYSHVIRWGNTASVKRFLTPAFTEAVGTYDGKQEFVGTLPAGFDRWAPLSKAQYIEMKTFMAGYLLSSQGDRVGMAHSIEGRFPFLDHHVVDFASRIPPHQKLRILEEKHILRRVAEDLVPAAVRDRPKQPYRAPDSASFFHGDEAGLLDLLAEDALRRAGYFIPSMVMRLIEKCGRMPANVSARDDMALVGILSTQLVHERFVAGYQAEEPPAQVRFVVRGSAA